MGFFKTYIKNLFPDYFWKADTNIDDNGKGTFQRYMEIFGDELDDTYENGGIKARIDNFTDILDSLLVEEDLLIHISNVEQSI